jgi:hypothetical protein
VHDLTGGPESGVGGTQGTAVLHFTDTPKPLKLAQDAYRLLELCDGRRGYAEIALALGVETESVLKAAAKLAKFGILDHLARGLAKTMAPAADSGMAISNPLALRSSR